MSTGDMNAADAYLKHLDKTLGPAGMNTTLKPAELAEIVKNYDAFATILKNKGIAQEIVKLITEKMMNALMVRAAALVQCNDPIALVAAKIGFDVESGFRVERAVLNGFAARAKLRRSASEAIDEVVLEAVNRFRGLVWIWKDSPARNPEEIADASDALKKLEGIFGPDAKQTLHPYLSMLAGMADAVLATKAQNIPEEERERLLALVFSVRDRERPS